MARILSLTPGKMKVVLLISLMFTLALELQFKKKPCQKTFKHNAYKTSYQRHIIPKSFDRNRLSTEWKK